MHLIRTIYDKLFRRKQKTVKDHLFDLEIDNPILVYFSYLSISSYSLVEKYNSDLFKYKLKEYIISNIDRNHSYCIRITKSFPRGEVYYIEKQTIKTLFEVRDINNKPITVEAHLVDLHFEKNIFNTMKKTTCESFLKLKCSDYIQGSYDKRYSNIKSLQVKWFIVRMSYYNSVVEAIKAFCLLCHLSYVRKIS